MRAFIALDIPEAFRSDIRELSQQLRALVKGRFMKSDTYHLTLAFLGETDETTIQAIMPLMDNLAQSYPAVSLYPSGLGKFGRSYDATFILKIQQNETLMHLVDDLRKQLTQKGISFDNKTFKPHITIARRATIPKAHLDNLRFPQPTQAGRLVLYKSTLTPEGALYKPLYEVNLSGESSFNSLSQDA